jgi:ElaB/YqjD/DUF883 family membrane-anchored ribosome-binding protein
MTLEIDQSKARAQLAQEKLKSTVSALRARLSPRALTMEVASDVGNRLKEAASDTIERVKSRPTLTIGVVAGAALLLFSKPIIGAVKRLTKETEHDG